MSLFKKKDIFVTKKVKLNLKKNEIKSTNVICSMLISI